MIDPTRREPVPNGDPARHRPLAELEAGLARLPQGPRERGRVLLIVRRCTGGKRETPERVRLSPEEGVPGDRWSHASPRNPEAQVTVMRADVADLIANGQSLTLFGDNLFVELDISVGQLPPGSRIRVGGALVAVTPEPHDGCHQFAVRFGRDALRFVSAKPTRDQNLRGIHWKVLESGDVAVGDPIEVLSRA